MAAETSRWRRRAGVRTLSVWCGWASALACIVTSVSAQEDEPRIVRPLITISPQTIESLILQARRTGTIQSVLEMELTCEIRAIDNRCTLMEVQRDRLQLAGRGDITRFLRRVDEIRTEYQSQRIDQQQYVEMNRRIQPLQIKMSLGLFGAGSLFQKSLKRTLTENQWVEYRALEQRRQLAVVQEALVWVAQRDSTFQLTAVQKRMIVELLLNETSPPTVPHPYASYIVIYQAGKLEHSLKPMMTESQWNSFQSVVRMAQRIEHKLVEFGLDKEAQIARIELAGDANNDGK